MLVSQDLPSIQAPLPTGSLAKPLVIVLLGPPGVGKGTHAAPLSRRLHFPHISTGDLFRWNIRNRTPLGMEADRFIAKGRLVPDALVFEMLQERVSQGDCNRGYLLDGFPRTLAQAESIENQSLIALYFHLPDEVLIERIVGRLSCKGCGRVCHRVWSPPKEEGSCDACGGSLYQREDDRAEVVRRRLEVYREETEPVKAHYAKKEGTLRVIDSTGAQEEVFERIQKELQKEVGCPPHSIFPDGSPFY
jgi:adenylate kinase